MCEYVLETSGLSKRYGRKKAIDNLDLKIRKGDIYGFIGPNGAGKTTLIKVVSGLISQNEGVYSLFGSNNLVGQRKKIGTVIESPTYYPYMSARENLKVHAIMKGIKDELIIDDLLETVGLADAGKKKVKNFSLGMKQRLAIALALMGDPEFLILDEPINGLDPMGIKEVRDLIIRLNRDSGITVLISSHILGELVKMCTAYGVITNGKLVAQFTAEELEQRVLPFIKITTKDAQKAADLISSELGITEVEVGDGFLKIYEKISEISSINLLLANNEILVSSILVQEGDYEDYFIDLMKGEEKDV